MTGKTGVLNSEQSAGSHAMGATAVKTMHVTRLQFPTHDSFKISHEVGSPAVHKKSGRVYFQVRALDPKRSAVTTDAIVRPFATDPKIGSSVGNAELYNP